MTCRIVGSHAACRNLTLDVAPIRGETVWTLLTPGPRPVGFLLSFPPGVPGLTGYVLVNAEQVHDLLQAKWVTP